MTRILCPQQQEGAWKKLQATVRVQGEGVREWKGMADDDVRTEGEGEGVEWGGFNVIDLRL